MQTSWWKGGVGGAGSPMSAVVEMTRSRTRFLLRRDRQCNIGGTALLTTRNATP